MNMIYSLHSFGHLKLHLKAVLKSLWFVWHPYIFIRFVWFNKWYILKIPTIYLAYCYYFAHICGMSCRVSWPKCHVYVVWPATESASPPSRFSRLSRAFPLFLAGWLFFSFCFARLKVITSLTRNLESARHIICFFGLCQLFGRCFLQGG